MVNYVSNFIPNLSDLITLLRTLLHEDVLWHCEKQQETSFKAIKEFLTLAPVLGHYDAQKVLTLQIDAEQLDINLVEHVISDQQLAKFVEATKEDDILSDLQQVILSGWPDSRGHVPLNAQQFWNYRDELSVAHGLMVKGQKIVVPNGLRGEMVERLHEGYLGINKTIARAREVLFWPGMTVDLTEKIKNCPVCLENRPSQQPEPLRSNEIPPLPWAKVGTDILHKNRRKWPELTLLPSMTSTGVITALRSQFVRYGIPSVLVSDNGPCYSSAEFKKFPEDWVFHHVTSSPGYPQSNGQSERTVQTVKSMLEKADDPYKALLFISEYSFGGRELVTIANVNEKASVDPSSNDQRNVKTPTV